MRNEPKFQFQIGAIKSYKSTLTVVEQLTFQFQIGAIKSQNNDVTARATREFQFQIGAIKSYGIVREDRQHSRFNSKLVRLKVRTVISCLLLLTIRFNSKLVRLKTHAQGSMRNSSLFQFQIGAIKRSQADPGD